MEDILDYMSHEPHDVLVVGEFNKRDQHLNIPI